MIMMMIIMIMIIIIIIIIIIGFSSSFFAWGHRLTLGCHNGSLFVIKEMMINDIMLAQYTSLLPHPKVKQH